MGNAKYKKEHREKHLCVDCSRPALGASIYCEVHSQKNRERSIKKMPKIKQKYKDENKCLTCSTPLLDIDLKDGYSTCCNCRQNIHRPKGLPYYTGE